MLPVHVEHLSSNAGLAWPFQAGASGIVFDQADPTALQLPPAVLVDLVLITPAPDLPWYMTRIDAPGTLVFSDGQVELLFELPGTVSGYQVLEASTADRVGRLVIHQPTLDLVAGLLAVQPVPVALGTAFPVNAATIKPEPGRVFSLEPRSDIKTVVDDPADDGGNRKTGHVQLVAGYNIDLDVDPTAGTITISAVPGAGEGTLPCDEAPELPRGPALVPDKDGNVEIESTDCYDVTTNKMTGTITIHHLCDPCCDCEDYIGVGNLINGLVAITNELRDALEALATAISAMAGYLQDILEEGDICPEPELIVKGSTSESDGAGSVFVLILNKSCDPITLGSMSVQLVNGWTPATYAQLSWVLYEQHTWPDMPPGTGDGLYVINITPDDGPLTLEAGEGVGVLLRLANLGADDLTARATVWGNPNMDPPFLANSGLIE